MRIVNSLPALLLVAGLALCLPSCKCQRDVSAMDELASLPAIDQRTFRPEEGHFVIANFWATWCGPCIQETPSLFRLASDHPEKITLVSISIDSGVSEVKKFLSLYPASQAKNVFILHDRGKNLAQKFNVTRYPESFIFAPDGKLIRHVPGAVDWSQLEFQKIFGL